MASTLPRGIANAALRCALVMRLGFVLFGIAGTEASSRVGRAILF
jgi:hypothetical protein